MASGYRLFGTETSPFSIKVRSYLRYKKLPFDWVPKGFGTDGEFQTLARSDALPMLVSPNGGISHDSSLILTRIEASRATPSAMPDDPSCRALALLLEDYADEWLNKAMFHFRWSSAKAAKVAAKRQAEHIFAGYEVEGLDEIEKSIAKSMSGRLKVIGLNKKNGEIVEASFERFLTLLNAHLEHHLFLFGGHPSLADFALAGQLIQLMMDEKSGDLIREKAPFVSAWCEFMEDPRPGAPFEDFDSLKETLLPLIRDEVAPTYVAWALANQASIASKRKTCDVEIGTDRFKQSVQHHTARSFEAVKAAFAATPSVQTFEDFLGEAGLGDVFDVGTAVPEPVETPEAEDISEDETTETQGEAADAADDKPSEDKPKRKSRSRRRSRKPKAETNADAETGEASDEAPASEPEAPEASNTTTED